MVEKEESLRELDAAFAEKVLGWTRGKEGQWYIQPQHARLLGSLPKFHLSQDAAWAGVEKLKQPEVEFERLIPSEPWTCVMHGNDEDYVGTGATPAEALCKACLEAVKK